jgi:hypothetical protein
MSNLPGSQDVAPKSSDQNSLSGGAASHAVGAYNLSAVVLRFPQITLFFLLAVAIAGTMAFLSLGDQDHLSRRHHRAGRQPGD